MDMVDPFQAVVVDQFPSCKDSRHGTQLRGTEYLNGFEQKQAEIRLYEVCIAGKLVNILKPVFANREVLVES